MWSVWMNELLIQSLSIDWNRIEQYSYLRKIEAIKNLFNSFDLTYTTIKGKKDSSKIEIEVASLNRYTQNSILIISASRDYGLDDLIFGPKERKILKNIEIPTMLINPRGDLYALCD